MQATQKQLAGIFEDDTTLIVPVYQRNYDWKKEQCEQLFKDIKNLVDDDDKQRTHFLGAIVVQNINPNEQFKKTIIIDGQQRITSIILFAKACCDFGSSDDIKMQLKAKFIKPAVPNSNYKFKLQPTEYDRPIFDKLMSDEELSDEEKNSNIYKNYTFFKDMLLNLNGDVSKYNSAIYRLQIVLMSIDNENPQQIFESLNSTGKDLTETELIRNFLLMDLDFLAQERLYKNYWLPIELLLKTSDVLENFMFQYLVARRTSVTDRQGGKCIHISKINLYDTFKKYFRANYGGDKTEQTEKMLADLRHNAEFYSRLIFDKDTNFSALPAPDKKFYALTMLIKSASAPIILMYLNERFEHGDFDEENFIAMVDALISLMFRAKVCKIAGIDSAQVAGNIIFRFSQNENCDVEAFWRAITAGNGKYTFPSDEDFKQALMSPELALSLKDTCKYPLYVLDGATDFKNYFDVYAEPIIPRRLTNAWKKYLREKNDSQAEQFVNSLGNLVLVESDKNKNAAFNDKRLIYNNSRFNLTREIEKSKDWTSRQIRRRAEVLAGRALAIWNLPAQYAQKINGEENIFTLDSDFSKFTWKKPAIVSISNIEKNITNWRDFLREIMIQLYNLDKEIFLQAAIDSGKSHLFADTAKNFETPFEIDGGYYMETHFRASDCLKIIKALVENFDRLGDTNFKDEIWFTLNAPDKSKD